MNRFFAVCFSSMGFRWARKWLAKIDHDILLQVVNALRVPNGHGFKSNPSITLKESFYAVANHYETADTQGKEIAANRAARNAKAMSDAEIGLVMCEAAMGTALADMETGLQEIAEKYGLFGLKKRHSKAHPADEEKPTPEAEEAKENISGEFEMIVDLPSVITEIPEIPRDEVIRYD